MSELDLGKKSPIELRIMDQEYADMLKELEEERDYSYEEYITNKGESSSEAFRDYRYAEDKIIKMNAKKAEIEAAIDKSMNM